MHWLVKMIFVVTLNIAQKPCFRSETLLSVISEPLFAGVLELSQCKIL